VLAAVLRTRPSDAALRLTWRSVIAGELPEPTA
jgi:hypothetical protein